MRTRFERDDEMSLGNVDTGSRPLGHGRLSQGRASPVLAEFNGAAVDCLAQLMRGVAERSRSARLLMRSIQLPVDRHESMGTVPSAVQRFNCA